MNLEIKRFQISKVGTHTDSRGAKHIFRDLCKKVLLQTAENLCLGFGCLEKDFFAKVSGRLNPSFRRRFLLNSDYYTSNLVTPPI